MNENQILKNKVASIGKIGFWITALWILISLGWQALYQHNLWSGNWLFDDWKNGFSVEELKQSPAREIICAVSLLRFLHGLAITIIILYLFRAVHRGQAISKLTANLVIVLGMLTIIKIFYLEISPLPLDERSHDNVGQLVFGLKMSPFSHIVFSVLAFAAAYIIRFANEQGRQLEEIV